MSNWHTAIQIYGINANNRKPVKVTEKNYADGYINLTFAKPPKKRHPACGYAVSAVYMHPQRLHK